MSKRLGRGLDALIPSLNINDDDKIIHIPLKKLRANPYQPRKNFDEDGIKELAASIKEHGVIQPIIVRTVLRGYEIIAGERRFKASQLCELESIPAVTRNFTDQQVMEIALIENLQREDLNAIEVANAYQGLIESFSLTQEELSIKVGKSRSHIANFLRILQLPHNIKELVSRGTLSMGHARAIVGLDDEKIIKEMTDLTLQKQWSVRDLEEAIQKLDSNHKEISKNKRKKKNPYINQAEEELREQYKTAVSIKQLKDKGKIEFTYYSKEDLERLLGLFHGDT